MPSIDVADIIERKKRQIVRAEFMLSRYADPKGHSSLTLETAEQWRTKLADLRRSLALLEG